MNSANTGIAEVFAALGDSTRVALLAKLATDGPGSATSLTAITDISRQAVDRHLRILEAARLVDSERTGREVLYSHRPATAASAADWLQQLNRAWEEQLQLVKNAAERK